MATASEQSKTIQSVDQAIEIIEYIGESGGATLSEIADACDFSKGTAYYYKETLMNHGYLINEDGTYRLGLRLLDPGIRARERQQGIDIIKSKVDELATETGERAHFIVEEHGLGINAYQQIGEQGVMTGARVGKPVYLHVSAAGKSILSHKPRTEVEEIINQRGLPALTDETITERDTLYEQLDHIYEQGYACIEDERRVGLSTIGAPITTTTEDVLGALSVTGPVRRMENTHQEYLPGLLLDMTEEIQLRLDYGDS